MKTIMKLKREVLLEYWKPLLKTLKSETDEKLDKIYNLNKRKLLLTNNYKANRTKVLQKTKR